MARKLLNPRQVEVLQWIAAGCPDGVMSGETHKSSAVVLKNRGLARISRRHGWHAELTDDGRYYASHGAYPGETPGAKRPTARRKSPAKPPPSDAPLADEQPEPASQSETDPRDDATEPSESVPTPRTITVPATLRSPHAAVAELRDAKGRLAVTSAVRSRALRVLQALVVAAEREGYRVEGVKPQRDGYGRVHYDSDSHLVIDTGETREGLRVFQKTDKTAHVPTPAEVREAERTWGRKPPKYDHTPNEYLGISLARTWGGSGRHTWSEGPRGQIDAKLPAILEEIELRHQTALEGRLRAEAEQFERERQWRIVYERAQVLLQEANRADVLSQQADDWQRARELRAYVEAMQQRAASLGSDEERDAAAEWIEWAAGYSERLDPLKRPIRMPAEVEAKPELLQPFMGGLSAHGPRRW